MPTFAETSSAAELFDLRYRANVLAEQGQTAAAIGAYRESLGAVPDCFPAHFNLGNALINVRRPVEAVESFVACLRLAPVFGAAYVNLACTLGTLGLLEQAQSMAELGVRHLPSVAEAKICLADALHDRSDFATAVALYRQAQGLLARTDLLTAGRLRIAESGVQSGLLTTGRWSPPSQRSAEGVGDSQSEHSRMLYEGASVGTTTPPGSDKKLANAPVGAKRMSRVIKMHTPRPREVSLPKTAALAKAQAEHKAWLKAHGIKATKNTLRT